MKTFEELGVCEPICRAISELGFVQPMPVQEEVIPYLLGDNNDIIALAQTGTGKTAAFGIPILQQIAESSSEEPSGNQYNERRQNRETQALILSPTRELCMQITDDMHDFSKYLKGINIVPVYGGSSMDTQIRSIRHGAQVIVATPGRLIDLMNRGKVDISKVRNVVLDEADEMLNMGFSESINTIFESLPAQRHTLLFSATMSKEIESIAMNYLHDHREVVIGSRNEGAENVNHVYYLVNAKDKYLALKRIVDYHPKIYAIIFCRTKIETQEIADKLIHDGYNAESLHGDLTQQQRDLAMQRFRDHNTQLLVATDVAARGLDVEDLTHVINYGMPDDIESYTHRSGRTGRAGKKGTSIAIIHTREKHKIKAVEKEIGKQFAAGTIPTPHDICIKQLYRAMDEIVKTDVNEEDIAPFMTEINRHFEYIDKEDIIKKMVSRTFGRFLAYYANAPELTPVEEKKSKKERKGEGISSRKNDDSIGRNGRRGDNSRGRSSTPQRGYSRLYINLGKDDGFYPGEVMQFLNHHIAGRQEVGHIDLEDRYSFIEVPQRDARKVIDAINGTFYGNREVRCNEADSTAMTSSERRKAKDDRRAARKGDKDTGGANHKEDDWRQFFVKNTKLKGEKPDFTEEGWAMRKPRKKK